MNFSKKILIEASFQSKTTESLKIEVSRLLQQVIPVLEACYTLPFRSLWLNQKPGKHYLQFLIQTEKILLWSWQRLNQNEQEELHFEILSWLGRQERKPDGLLKSYYLFYEALGDWVQQTDGSSSGSGRWEDYIFYVLCHENHFLKRTAFASVTPQHEDLELIAQQYLAQMQLICELDLFILCLDVFTFFGVFTRKSYFIPQLTFPATEYNEASSISRFEKFRIRLKESAHWSESANEYLQTFK
ncbi:MAG: hypothetical protein HQM13_14680 [SAR324 cluster bacterium]|nr:hypothetical protein [SAR324 cluster bacterium]